MLAWRSQVTCQVLLEAIHIGSQRHHPVGVKRLLYKLLLSSSHLASESQIFFCAILVSSDLVVYKCSEKGAYPKPLEKKSLEISFWLLAVSF